MTVDTREFTCGKDGVLMWRLSTAILHGAGARALTQLTSARIGLDHAD